ncbi:MAG: ECF-type sigma factor [Planctomycetota bacterium]
MNCPDSSDRSTLRMQADAGRPRTTSSELLRVSRLELRRLARRMSEAERSAPPVEPTTLVNEVARRLLGASGAQDMPCRGDYYADLANAFRQLLRSRAMHSLPAETPLRLAPLSDVDAAPASRLDAALAKLEDRSPRHAQIAVLRLLGGLTFGEIAEQMCLSERRVTTAWQEARNWLERRL